MRLVWASLIIALANTTPIFAQNNDEKLLASAHLDKKNTTSPLIDKLEVKKPIAVDFSRLNLDLDIRYRNSDDLDELVFNYTNDIIVIEYKGLHGLVFRQINKQCKKYFTSRIRDYWENSYLDLMDLEKKKRNFFQQYEEVRWWERPWYHSLPIEKGGSSVRTVTIGSNFEILKAGPLSLSNSGKIAWTGGWGIDVDTEGTEFKKDDIEEDNWSDNLRPSRRNLAIGISAPNGNITEGENWSLSGSIKANLKASSLGEKNSSSFRAFVNLKCYFGSKSIQWLDAELRITTKPMQKEHEVAIIVALTSF